MAGALAVSGESFWEGSWQRVLYNNKFANALYFPPHLLFHIISPRVNWVHVTPGSQIIHCLGKENGEHGFIIFL